MSDSLVSKMNAIRSVLQVSILLAVFMCLASADNNDGDSKVCQHHSSFVHSGNIDNFRGCSVINGSIDIFDETFAGFQQVFSNFTFGPRFDRLHPDRLQVFSNVKEITGYLNVEGVHEDFKNLSCFDKLQTIGGRRLKLDLLYSLAIEKSSLETLTLNSLTSIENGFVVISKNKKLCLKDENKWNEITKDKAQKAVIGENQSSEVCKNLSKVN